MNNENWNSGFPGVPEHVHQTVLSTLAGLDDGKVKRVKRMKKSKIIILIAAAVAMLGTTVSASEILNGTTGRRKFLWQTRNSRERL